jgi:DNA-binding NarL/FixJ family response regulator
MQSYKSNRTASAQSTIVTSVVSDPQEAMPAPNTSSIIVIEERELLRECLTRCLEAALGSTILSFLNVESWLKVREQTPACVVVLSMGGNSRSAASMQRDIGRLNGIPVPLPVVLLADAEEPGQIIEALERGVRGYIPTSLSLAIALEAVRLVRAGGIYVPAASLVAANGKNPNGSKASGGGTSSLTKRQAAVLDALRKGKPNKIIAYELAMCESTVKVHVRNIMKKLKASNRTEVAYMTRDPMSLGGWSEQDLG